MSKPTLDIERMGPEERLELMEQLWESLRRDPSSVPLTEAQREELDRRLAVTTAIIRPAAAAEIDDAYLWYESRRSGLGEEFLAGR